MRRCENDNITNFKQKRYLPPTPLLSPPHRCSHVEKPPFSIQNGHKNIRIKFKTKNDQRSTIFLLFLKKYRGKKRKRKKNQLFPFDCVYTCIRDRKKKRWYKMERQATTKKETTTTLPVQSYAMGCNANSFSFARWLNADRFYSFCWIGPRWLVCCIFFSFLFFYVVVRCVRVFVCSCVFKMMHIHTQTDIHTKTQFNGLCAFARFFFFLPLSLTNPYLIWRCCEYYNH